MTARTRRLTPTLAALAVAVSLAPVSVSPATAEGSSSSAVGSGALQIWAPGTTGPVRDVTAASAVQRARDFDLILAAPKTFAPYVKQMRVANPRLVLLSYVNARFVPNRAGEAFPDSWYLRDVNGQKVRSTFYGNYMMDAHKDGWVANRVDACASTARQGGYDGCYLDLLGSAPISPDYTTGAPVNPATGRVFTARELLTDNAELAGKIRAGVAPKVVQGNGLTDGVRYFDLDTDILFSTLDTVIAEGFLRGGRSPLEPYPTTTDFLKNVRMLVDAGSRGKSVLAYTKLWTEATRADKDAWHRYALATFLLGADGSARFYLSYEPGQDPTSVHPWWRTQLGEPTGAFSQKYRRYERTFANGKVLVNPGTAAVTVPLERSYRTLEGRIVRSVTLGAHGAEILTRA